MTIGERVTTARTALKLFTRSRSVDVLTPARMAGWIKPDANGTPARLRLTVAGEGMPERSLGEVSADRERSDLRRVTPDGRAGFDVKLRRGDNDFADRLPRGAVFRLREAATDTVICEVAVEGRADVDRFTNPFGEDYVLYQKDGGFVVPLANRKPDWWAASLSALDEAFGSSAETGIPLQIGYGTLLGHVREDGYIGHDDDLDVVLHCGEQPDPLAASIEFTRRLERLFGAKRVRQDTNGQAHVRFVRDRVVPLDVFASWTCEGRYYQNFTIAGGLARSDVLPLGEATFMDHAVRVPKNPEAVLEAIYGPNWRTPDPSFRWQRPDEVERFFKPMHDYRRGANKDYWEGYYAKARPAVAAPLPPSQFAAFVTDFLAPDDTVVEFGCGNARDSLFLAAHGWTVRASDYSDAAIRTNEEKAAERGQDRITFDACNVADAHAIDAFLSKTPTDTRRVFYSRFFLHAISDAAEETMRAAIDRAAEPGDLLAIETRIAEDEARQKVTPEHYRRFVDGDAVIAAWQGRGWTTEYEVRGVGYAKYKADDAHVMRLIMRKG